MQVSKRVSDRSWPGSNAFMEQGQLRHRICRFILGRGCRNIRMTLLRDLRSRTRLLQGELVPET